MASGLWQVVYGKWFMASGLWQVVNDEASHFFRFHLLELLNWQVASGKCQRPSGL